LRKNGENSGNGTLQYESTVSMRSNKSPGVTFVIHRISFGRRMELSRRVRELSRRVEFLEAGAKVQEKIEAGIVAQEIDAMYLRWGLVSVQGMTIDGEPADCERLIEKGPEELVSEIVGAVKAQCGLSEAEIKN
jgi:hypothetical protein